MYVTRIFRIVPLVAVAFVLITIVIIARTGAMPDMAYIGTAARWISSWDEPPILGYPDSGRINAYVLWSLWYEWLFYIFVLPACAGLMDVARRYRWRTWIVPLAIFCTALVVRLVAARLELPAGLLNYLPLFAIGMLAFECRAHPSVRSFLSKPALGSVAMLVLLVGMVTTSTPYGASLPLFAFFFICVSAGNSLGSVLRTRGALVLGECSFGIYLLHGIVLDMVFVDAGAMHRRLDVLAMPVLLPVVIVLVVPTTLLSYLLVERPAMRAGRSLARKLARRRITLNGHEIAIAP